MGGLTQRAQFSAFFRNFDAEVWGDYCILQIPCQKILLRSRDYQSENFCMVQNCSKQSVETTNTSSSTSCAISPAKLATLRSNYIQQMRDVHALFESGAINEAEQKKPILEQLKALKPV